MTRAQAEFLQATGSGRATEVSRRILRRSTAEASLGDHPALRPWLRQAGRGYISLRRLVRQIVIRTSWLDRSVGRALGRFERHLPVRGLLQGVSTGQVQCHGMSLHYRPADMGVISTILLYGDYEPETTRTVVRLLEPGMCFVDLGAHIGYLTILAARAVGPTGRLWAFEPVASTRETLCLNLAENDVEATVTVVPKAISDSIGWVRFSIDEKNSASSRIAIPDDDARQTVVEIETTSLDEFFAAIGWPQVNLLKMDVEGAELAALRGMDELSRRNPGLGLIFELNPPHLARLGLTPQVLFEELHKRGFCTFRILHRNGIVFSWHDGSEIASLSQGDTVNILALKEQG